MKSLIGVLFAGALALLPGSAAAQAHYPSRSVTIIVPAAPGGGLDATARELAHTVERALKVSFVIENRVGAAGMVGMNGITRAEPDGYTLGFVTNGMLTVAPHTMTVPFSKESYIPIVRIGVTSYVMCVKPDFPATNGKELVDQLAKNPGKYSYGNDGTGGTMHIAAEAAFRKLGVKAVAVPFRGGQETLTSFLGGHIDIFGGGLPSILPYIQSGAAKCLLLTSAADNRLAPQASGLAAVGVTELEGGLWFGLIAPRGVPREIVDRLASAFTEAASSPEVVAALARLGAEPGVLGPTDFAALIARDFNNFAVAAKDIGLSK